jgi:outer membrane protein assembly factor BamB
VRTLLLITLILAGLSAFAADTAGRYVLTLTAQGGPSIMVALTAPDTHFSTGEKYAPNPQTMDVTDSQLDGTKVRATLTFTLGEATYRFDVDAVNEADAITGKFLGRWGDLNVNGTVTGRRIPLGYMGYRGDGSGVSRDANPPSSWNTATGKNVRWSAPLPSWGNSSPVITGDRVFLTCEPDATHDFPQLLCLSVADGTILWQKELDPFPAMKLAAEDEKALRAQWHTLIVASQNILRDLKPPSAGVMEGLAAHGLGLLTQVGRTGYATPTPVTDGARVYVVTNNQYAACYDLAGAVIWQAALPSTVEKVLGGWAKYPRSPLLYRDLLISDIGGQVCALDTATGTVRWQNNKVFAGGTAVSPAIITVGGTDVLLVSTSNPGITAFRLPDGVILPDVGWKDCGGTILVKPDEPDVVFFGGAYGQGWEFTSTLNRALTAVRFKLGAAQALEATVLWQLPVDNAPADRGGIVYSDGKLFTPTGQVFDAATGALIAGAAAPLSASPLWVAGGRVFGVHETRTAPDAPAVGTVQVFDLSGAPFGESTLPVPTPDAVRAAYITALTGKADWGFSSACPFAIAGNALFVRSNDMLFCLSRVK